MTIFAGSTLLGPALSLGLSAMAPQATPATTQESHQEAGAMELLIRVRRAGDRLPVKKVEVFVVSDEDGAILATAKTSHTGLVLLSLNSIDLERAHIVVLADGFERLELGLSEARAVGEKELSLFLRPAAPLIVPVVREVRHDEDEEAVEVPAPDLDQHYISSLAGNQGDPLRALQMLPGVGRVPFGLGALSLRGASPHASQVYLGGHRVPRGFHAYAQSSSVTPAAVDGVNLYIGNFGAQYGAAASGIAVIEPLRGEGVPHARTDIDPLTLATRASGGVRSGSFIVALRRSHAMAIAARAANSSDERAWLAGASDYYANLEFPVGRDVRLGLRALGAGDRLPTGWLSDHGTVGMYTRWHRVDAYAQKDSGRWHFLSSASLRVESHNLGDISFGNRVFGYRLETSYALTPWLRLKLGSEAELNRYSLPASVPMPGPAPWDRLALYTSLMSNTTRLWVEPGLRLERSAVSDANLVALDPRVRAGVRFNESWQLTGAFGLYTQAERVFLATIDDFLSEGRDIGVGYVQVPYALISSVDDVPNPSIAPDQINARRALSVSLGPRYEHQGLLVAARGFYRRDRLDPEQEWSSDARGAELEMRYALGRRLAARVSYTFLLATGHQESTGRDYRLDFDQRHNLSASLARAFKHGWVLTTRFRASSGVPFAEILGGIDSGFGEDEPVFGDPRGGDTGWFHQLDLRVAKMWRRPRCFVSAYLDVQNVYNQRNTEIPVYSSDFRELGPGYGLPIFPVLGMSLGY